MSKDIHRRHGEQSSGSFPSAARKYGEEGLPTLTRALSLVELLVSKIPRHVFEEPLSRGLFTL